MSLMRVTGYGTRIAWPASRTATRAIVFSPAAGRALRSLAGALRLGAAAGSLAIASLGCLPRDPLPDTAEALDPPARPLITSVTLRCDVDAGRWTFAVSTDAWSGGANLFWTADGAYVERHPAVSVEAAADGSGDLLRANLNIVAAPIDSAPGARTAIPCSATPTAAVWVDDLQRIGSDCRIFGPAPDALNAINGVQACTVALGDDERSP